MKIYTKYESAHDSVKYSNENKHIILYNGMKIDVINIATNQKFRVPFHRWQEEKPNEIINHYSNIQNIFASDLFESIYVLYSYNKWDNKSYMLQHFDLKTHKNTYIDIPKSAYAIQGYDTSIFPLEIKGNHFLILNSSLPDKKTAFINLNTSTISVKEWGEQHFFNSQYNLLYQYISKQEMNHFDIHYNNHSSRTLIKIKINLASNIFKKEERIFTVQQYASQQLTKHKDEVFLSFTNNSDRTVSLFNITKDFNGKEEAFNSRIYYSNIRFQGDKFCYNTYELEHKDKISIYNIDENKTKILKTPMLSLPEFKTRMRDYVNSGNDDSAFYQSKDWRHIYVEKSNLKKYEKNP